MMTSPRFALPLDALRAFCQRWNVSELRRTAFDLVRMGDELRALLGRDVDLVEKGAIERSDNNLRRRRILNAAQVVYRVA